jgi:hypothetical protein
MKRIGTLVQVIHNLRFAGFFFLITVLVFDAALELATCLSPRIEGGCLSNKRMRPNFCSDHTAVLNLAWNRTMVTKSASRAARESFYTELGADS